MRCLLNRLLNKKTYSSGLVTETLLRDPIPLYSKDIKLALFWSAKSGCTYAVKWFFHQAGMLETAAEYSSWVHDYRENIFSVASEFREGISSICENDTKVVKVVRNPYSRAVSSYLMAVRSGYENEALGAFLGRTVDAKDGFSFAEFLDYLSSIDLRNCNIHHRLQVHPAEEAKLVDPDFIIHLEDSFKETVACERELGLPESNLARFRASGHNTARRIWPDFWGEVKLYRRLGNKILPEGENFYNLELRSRVETLYREDFSRYCYPQVGSGKNTPNLLVVRNNQNLLQELREQIPISGPGELAEEVTGFWSDGWCGSVLSVSFKAQEDLTQVTIIGCLPGELIHENVLDIEVEGYTMRVDITNAEDFIVRLPINAQSGNTTQFTVKSSLVKSGVEEGLNNDKREIAFFLKEIRLQ